MVTQHNPNDALRPGSKMLGVCGTCHGLAFSIDALADRDLVQRNFTGRSSRHVGNVDMVDAKLKKAKP